MTRPVGIGNQPITRRERAEIALETALAERDLTPVWAFEAPSNGPGIVAVVLNGERQLFRLEQAGTDEADAMFRLASLVSRPYDPRRGF